MRGYDYCRPRNLVTKPVQSAGVTALIAVADNEQTRSGVVRQTDDAFLGQWLFVLFGDLTGSTKLYTVFSMSRSNLSTEIRTTIREEIICGKLRPQQRLNEVHLAKRLDISRTPLREALFGLVNEKFVYEIPRRGFFVAALSVEELKQLYVIRQILDPNALQLAGIPGEEKIVELELLNKKIAKVKKVQDIISLDDLWHLKLIEGCNNEILIGLIKAHMSRTRRYEFAYFSQAGSIGVATQEHILILDALRNRKLSQACKFLKQNMTSAEGPLFDWVREQQVDNPASGPSVFPQS